MIDYLLVLFGVIIASLFFNSWIKASRGEKLTSIEYIFSFGIEPVSTLTVYKGKVMKVRGRFFKSKLNSWIKLIEFEDDVYITLFFFRGEVSIKGNISDHLESIILKRIKCCIDNKSLTPEK